jgi:hypothetical protein
MKVRRQWPRVVLSNLFDKLFPKFPFNRSGAPRFVEAEFSKVLSRDELAHFLGDVQMKSDVEGERGPDSAKY